MIFDFFSKKRGHFSAHGEYEHGIDPPLACCPFCGAEGEDLELTNTHTPFYSVECQNCDAQGPTGRDTKAPASGRYRSAADYERAHRDAFGNAIVLWNDRSFA